MAPIDGADKRVRDIKGDTRRNRSPEDKIRSVIDDMRGEHCCMDVIPQNLF